MLTRELRVGFKHLALMLAFVALAFTCLVACSSSESPSCHEGEVATFVELTDEGAAERYFDPDNLGFVVEDSSEPLVIDTYSRGYGGNVYVYDSEYLDMIFDYDSVTPEKLKQTVAINEGIPEKYKELVDTYIDRVVAVYPEADLRPFEFNLRTLKMFEVGSKDMILKGASVNTVACYIQSENCVYLMEGIDCKPGTWDYQVLFHELSHALRSMNHCESVEGKERKLRYSTSSYDNMNIIANEALNSLFAVSLFDYEERDIAYQLESNMVAVMIECMDDYTLADYVNHSTSYFYAKLDEANGNNNYAKWILKLMEAQRDDADDFQRNREQEVYYPLYDYVCKMWLMRYAELGLSEDGLNALVDELLERVMYDVPKENYRIDTQEFYRYAQAHYDRKKGFVQKSL